MLLTVASLQALANFLSTRQTCVKPTNLLKFEVTTYRLWDPQVVRLDAVNTILDLALTM